MITISFSELDAFRQCAFKHQLAHVELWQKEDPKGALYRGTAWHTLMELHYKKLATCCFTKEQLLSHCYSMLEAWEHEGESSELLELLQWMYEGYLDRWGLDTQWEIRAVEWQGVVPLNHRFQLGFTIDLIVEDEKGRHWVVDHKTGRNLPTEKDLDFHEQFALYTWALRKLGKPVFGSIWNAARTTRNKGDYPEYVNDKRTRAQTLDERFSRVFINKTDKELEMTAHEAILTAERMYPDTGLNIFDPRTRHDAPRSFNADTCSWKCSFTEACLLGRRTGDNQRTRQFLSDTGFVRGTQRRYEELA
jgi:hypothetical protein